MVLCWGQVSSKCLSISNPVQCGYFLIRQSVEVTQLVSVLYLQGDHGQEESSGASQVAILARNLETGLDYGFHIS